MERIVSRDTNIDLDTIVHNLNISIGEAVKKNLIPFVRNAQENQDRCTAISEVLRQLPEFKALVEENAKLSAENRMLRFQLSKHESTPVQLRVTEIDSPSSVSVGSINQSRSILDSLSTEGHSNSINNVSESDSIEDEDESYNSSNEESPIRCGLIKNAVDMEKLVNLTKEDQVDQDDEEAGHVEEVEQVEEVEEDEEAGHVEEVEQDEEEGEEETEQAEEEVEEVEEDEEEVEEVEKTEEEDEEESSDENSSEGSTTPPSFPSQPRSAEVLVENDEEDEEEEELFVVELDIDGDVMSYYCSDTDNGIIYDIDEHSEIGPEVGKFVDGEPIFNEH